MADHVELAADVFMSCLTHALSTEREEVMGLLLGEMLEDSKVAHICSLHMMRRSDKRPDRVEISPEQLSAAAIEAEVLASRLKRNIRVLGWYHSHPHITVWPSHVDIRTQADYQMMDPNFVGLIFSCFHEVEKKYSTKLICFQSFNKADPGDPPVYHHLEIPIRILPTPLATISPDCLSATTRLLQILFDEEKEAYVRSQSSCKDHLTSLHNGAVYSQCLAHILQVLAGPIMQLLENELSRNKALMTKLTEKREQLKSVLSMNSGSEDDDMV